LLLKNVQPLNPYRVQIILHQKYLRRNYACKCTNLEEIDRENWRILPKFRGTLWRQAACVARAGFFLHEPSTGRKRSSQAPRHWHLNIMRADGME
jgi:hypothetical protein